MTGRLMKPHEVEEARLQTVVKSNELIQKSRYQLSLLEQKIVLFFISKIKPEDAAFTEYEFPMRDLCRLMGISHNPKNYQNFKDAIQDLADKSFWVETDTTDMLCRWVTDAKIIKGNSVIKIRLDDKLKPYLLQLQKQFTSFSLEYVLLMKSKYSIRLYELLKSYQYVHKYVFELDELKKRIEANGYSHYTDFRVKVLEPAIYEINEYTDIDVDVFPIRDGRSIKFLEFSIMQKDDHGTRYARMRRKNGFEQRQLHAAGKKEQKKMDD